MTSDAPAFLPYGRQVIEDDDIEAVVAALKSDYLTTGPRVAEFETALAAATGAKHAIACANGTAALHLAARALRLGPGTTSVVPAVTFLATANAVRLNGGDVVFADVDPQSGLMRVQDLDEALNRCPNRRADAVFNVHLAGQVGDLEGINDLARSRGSKIVEDACHALGTDWTSADGVKHRAGDNHAADLSCFSFHPVKTIAMGEGGAVTTNDAALARKIARDRTHGMSRDRNDFTLKSDAFDAQGAANSWFYEMDEPGLNYRVPDILCALGTSQLRKLDRFVTRRRVLASTYDTVLQPLAPKIVPLKKTPGVAPALHLYVVLIDFASLGVTRNEVMRRLAGEGVGSQVHYFPVYRQPYYAKQNPALKLAGADAYYDKCLSLPLYPSMTEGDVIKVVAALKRAVSR